MSSRNRAVRRGSGIGSRGTRPERRRARRPLPEAPPGGVGFSDMRWGDGGLAHVRRFRTAAQAARTRRPRRPPGREPDLGHGPPVVRRLGDVVDLRVLVALDREALRRLGRVGQRGVAALAVRRVRGGGALLGRGLGDRPSAVSVLDALVSAGVAVAPSASSTAFSPGRRAGLLRRPEPPRWRPAALRPGNAPGPVRLVRDGLLRHQLDHGHGGVVALARQRLGDARVAAVAVGEERADLVHQPVHGLPVPDHLLDLAAVVQVAALGLGDQALGVRAQPLGLGLGRGDLAVLEQRGRQVGQDQPLVRGRAAEAGALGGLRHGYSCSVSA